MSAPWQTLAGAWNCTTDALGQIQRALQSNSTTPLERKALMHAQAQLHGVHTTLSPIIDAHRSHDKIAGAGV